MNYESTIKRSSEIRAEVSYVVRRMSFGRRMDLMHQVRSLAAKQEFFRAGNSEEDQMDSGLLSAEIDRLYLKWGLSEVHGLIIDNQKATVDVLMESGPEEIFLEALRFVKSECGISEAERKN